MKKLLPLLMITFVTISCSNEIEESYFQNDSSKEQNLDIAATEQEETFSRAAKVSQLKTRANDDIVDDELVVVYGSDRIETAKRGKFALKSAAASKFGLPQGIYVVEYLICYKNVYKPGYDIWSEKSQKCGYKPSIDFILGNNSIALTNERGYEEPASNAKELKTFVLHVISDLYGQSLDLYAPCTPKDIEWKYSISPQ